MRKKQSRINVTKTFLPPIGEYQEYLEKIWDSVWLTNQGPLLQQFEAQTEQYLGVKNLHFVSNGTLALQVSLHALGINGGEVITTPFSYVATTSTILWERCKPVFVDIEPTSLCIDPTKIEAAITKETKAIMAVHVFGHPCDVEKIEKIAKKHKLKVIYDGAHAFGVQYKGQSIFNYGDVSICSFHSTKLFHTIEGGCVITPSKAISDKVELIKRFGHHGDDHYMLGINAKANEFQAAMGLCNFKYISEILEKRKQVVDLYDTLLGDAIRRPSVRRGATKNYAYYPVILKDEKELLRVMDRLATQNIFPRRYFYPSLNTLPYLEEAGDCPVSEDISTRILCLPLYPELEEDVIKIICEVITK
ncbi:MAG: DegT/DnrJ/EryC1/StrS family aminotransferase [Candidatus Saccharimonadales bacterium]